MAAMVACCERRGLDETSVEDLLRLSGVSRSTFYDLFDDKVDCFRAAEEEVVGMAIAAIAERLGSDGDALERARSALDGFVELVVAQPAAARMCLVDGYAAGPEATVAVDAAVERVVALGVAVLEQTPGHWALPEGLVRGIVGGFYKVIYDLLQAHRENELAALLPQLWDWALSFPPPPRELRRPGRSSAAPAPGAAPFAAYSTEQRIIRGFAATVAAKGFSATTISDVCAAASISPTTFYEYFDSKGDALWAALDSSGAQLMSAVLPAIRRVADWRVAVRVGFEEMCAYFAAEPDFATLRLIGVFAAGPEAIAQRDRIGHEVVEALIHGDEISDLVAEATTGAILAILSEGVRAGDDKALLRLAPTLAYLTLSPFVGADEACDVATGRGRSIASRSRSGLG